jgi:hypothetical protein
METKHTKGEWKLNYSFSKAVENEDNCQWVSIYSESNNLMAEIKGQHYGIPEYEMHANAKLMAAAPDLLKALNDCVQIMESITILTGHKPCIERAKQAIEKATI